MCIIRSLSNYSETNYVTCKNLIDVLICQKSKNLKYCKKLQRSSYNYEQLIKYYGYQYRGSSIWTDSFEQIIFEQSKFFHIKIQIFEFNGNFSYFSIWKNFFWSKTFVQIEDSLYWNYFTYLLIIDTLKYLQSILKIISLLSVINLKNNQNF